MLSDRPSISALRARALADLAQAELGENPSGPPSILLRRSIERSLAVVVAGLADGLWGSLEWLAEQVTPLRCSEEFLQLWGTVYAVERREGEALEAWRERILRRISTPPRGGAQGDYRAWALEVSGVDRAWELPLFLGPGSVGVVFVRLDEDGAYDPAATAALRPDVQAALDVHKPLGGIRPVAIVPIAVGLDVRLKLSPNTATVRAAVDKSIRQYLGALAPGQAVLFSQLRTAVGQTPGVVDHRLLFPTTDVSIPRAGLPVLSSLTTEAL